MIKEKPTCPYCNGICGSNNPDPIYLKKIEYGWKCPQCNQKYYGIPVMIMKLIPSFEPRLCFGNRS